MLIPAVPARNLRLAIKQMISTLDTDAKKFDDFITILSWTGVSTES
jgi:hypothetical protein